MFLVQGPFFIFILWFFVFSRDCPVVGMSGVGVCHSLLFP